MMIPGEGTAYESCTDIVGWRKCPSCGYAEPMHQNCSRVTCPVCFGNWVSKAASRVSKRIHGFSHTALHVSESIVYCTVQTIYPKRLQKVGSNCRHLVISPKSGVITEDMPLSKVFDISVKHLKKHFPGVLAGEIFFHPFRLREYVRYQLIDYCKEKQIEEPSYSSGGFWKLAREDVLNLGSLDAYRVFSPHWHMLCFGYFPNAKDYNDSTDGWVYKNVRSVNLEITKREDGTHNDDVEAVASYLLTHCGIELNDAGKAVKTRRTYGLMTPRYFRRLDGYSFVLESFRLCPECQTELIVCDENEIPKLHHRYDPLAEDDIDDYVMCSVITKIPNYELHTPELRVKRIRVESIPVFSMIDDQFMKKRVV